MINHNNYYYKGYDISNKNRLEKMAMECCNPYGYNLGSTSKRIIDEVAKYTFTNQDLLKNKSFKNMDKK
ncbi:MAG: hypothetical protein E7172_03960 [Firmicutes bacterium]|nr:hypothetical protein [Bacillota bacterium]